VAVACDGLATGRRILAIVDAFTRECLTLEVDTSLSSQRVTRALEQAIGLLSCRFASIDRDRTELAARALRLAHILDSALPSSSTGAHGSGC
jgi:transposase InsO family protein